MPFVLLAFAIAFEVTATLAMRGSEGFTKLGPSLIVVVGYLTSFVFMAKALTSLNVGPVYAIWSALGTIGAFVGGVLLYDEQVKPLTIIGAAIIVLGVIVMNLGGGVHQG
ncbi:DMT family transporter [Actinomadura syzygii]|uniref:Multidrug efflux SMR transporter n=1 Tax=Actinomadura syzygii TaxID=1427538 RepID=A0A5D0TQB4_9ACTN|nr:multidrug efflux SMR transporter [Actinomadura syzygii]TYC08064.1 multidrug efflux SMR transporter [Actinomadura syzygii]